MPRNIDRTVEVLFPLEGEKLIREMRDEVLPVYLADNVKARSMSSAETYTRKRSGENRKRINAQEVLLARRRIRSGRGKAVRTGRS
jgi:polyphosphate kinase